MNKPDVTLNYITLIGVGIVAYFVFVAVVRAHAEFKRTQKRNASFFNDKGQAVIEFALVLPFLLLLALGVVEFGRAWMTMNILTSAAREGARLAAVVGTSKPAVVVIKARVNDVLEAAHVVPTDITPTATPDGLVRVSVSTDFVIVSGKVLGKFSGTIPLSATSVFRSQS